jgi:phosphoribosylaminoimidazole-succinocarboxamide synthase
VTDLLSRGKVRDIQQVAPDQLLIVATDRISAFDVVLPTTIPDKGRVLTGLSLHWFERTDDLVPNHLLTTLSWPPWQGDFAGRSLIVKRAKVIPVECVARGYLSGSGWVQYRESRSVCGVPLPAGLVESERLPESIFTPTTKADEGHDLPLTFEETIELIGRGLAERLRELTIAVYERIAAEAGERGVIVADTKLEFGFAEGELILIDEVGTPDSSRFWPAESYEPGRTQPSFDKQYVRDWLDSSGWDRRPPAPALPDDVVAITASKYREAYERITEEPFDEYLRAAGAKST